MDRRRNGVEMATTMGSAAAPMDRERKKTRPGRDDFDCDDKETEKEPTDGRAFLGMTNADKKGRERG